MQVIYIFLIGYEGTTFFLRAPLPLTSVLDLYHFDVDPDPDLQIRFRDDGSGSRSGSGSASGSGSDLKSNKFQFFSS